MISSSRIGFPPLGAKVLPRQLWPSSASPSLRSREPSNSPLMNNPNQLVQKLWNYCNILRGDGLSYGDYVEQLTFLLFLKIADEQSKPPFNKPSPIPKNSVYRLLGMGLHSVNTEALAKKMKAP